MGTDWITRANRQSKPCEHCGQAITTGPANKRYCDPECRKAARRQPPPDPDPAAEFLARFEAYEFDPAEAELLEEAAYVVGVLDDLRNAPRPNPREIRLQQEQLRRLLTAIDWPDSEMTESQRRSWAGRNLARQRWG